MSLKIDTSNKGDDKNYRVGKSKIRKMVAKHDYMPCKCMRKDGFIPFKKGMELHILETNYIVNGEFSTHVFFVSTSPSNPFGRNHVSGYVTENEVYCEDCNQYSDYFETKSLF